MRVGKISNRVSLEFRLAPVRVAYPLKAEPQTNQGSWKALSALRPCIGTVNQSGQMRVAYATRILQAVSLVHRKPPFVFFRMHWDHEPVGRVTPCAPQFGNAQTARRGLTRPTFRFMESLLGFFAVHWDPEPDCVARFVWCPAFRRSEPAKAGTPNRRLMESPLSPFSACIGTMNR